MSNPVLNINISGIDQSQYKVFNEVQLWVDKAKGQYMIADILLVKFDGTKIDDVIICESKLNNNTDYTKRQKQGWRLINSGIPKEVKVLAINKIINTTNPPTFLDGDVSLNLLINKTKAIRINDSGDKNGNFYPSSIILNTYSNFTTNN